MLLGSSNNLLTSTSAFVHYFTKRGFGEVYFFPHDGDQHGDEPSAPVTEPTSRIAVTSTNKVHPEEQVFSIDNHLSKEDTSVQIQSDDQQDASSCQDPRKVRRQSRWDGMQMNSVSKIDKISRVVFPALFLTINFFYWYIYI